MWFFAYGTSTDPEQIARDLGPIAEFKPASICDHRLFFTGNDPEWGGGTSCIVPQLGRRVIGTAYRISSNQREQLLRGGHGYEWTSKVAKVDAAMIDVGVLLPPAIGPFSLPADAYIARIRYGLSFLYPMLEVDPYLREALNRPNLFIGMLGRWVQDEIPNREYGINFRRLYPWKGIERAPWGGAWGTIAPGEDTGVFVHDEEETAIVLAGTGQLRVDRDMRAVRKGDVVYFPPNCEHVFTNNSTSDLEVLFIWWGGADAPLWAGRQV
jgi:hypothetical protein